MRPLARAGGRRCTAKSENTRFVRDSSPSSCNSTGGRASGAADPTFQGNVQQKKRPAAIHPGCRNRRRGGAQRIVGSVIFGGGVLDAPAPPPTYSTSGPDTPGGSHPHPYQPVILYRMYVHVCTMMEDRNLQSARPADLPPLSFSAFGKEAVAVAPSPFSNTRQAYIFHSLDHVVVKVRDKCLDRRPTKQLGSRHSRSN